MVSFYRIQLETGYSVRIRKNFVRFLEQQRCVKKGSATISLSQDFTDPFNLSLNIKEIIGNYDGFSWDVEYYPGTFLEVDLYQKVWRHHPVLTWKSETEDLDNKFYCVNLLVWYDHSLKQLEVLGLVVGERNCLETFKFLVTDVNPLMFQDPSIALEDELRLVEADEDEGFQEEA